MSTTKKELDIRCIKCNKLVAKDKYNMLEVKCVRCDSINDIFNYSSELTIIGELVVIIKTLIVRLLSIFIIN